MEAIGKSAMRVAASPRSPPDSALPIVRATVLPAILNPAVDVDLPRRLFSAWTPQGGKRGIVRPLSSTEYAAVSRRAAELRVAIAPYGDGECNAVGAALAGMLGGFRSMRQGGDDALLMLEGMARVLGPYPLWAIERACMLIRSGESGLDPRFPPNDSQVCDVVRDQLSLYRRHLENAEALLAAPIDEEGNYGSNEKKRTTNQERASNAPALPGGSHITPANSSEHATSAAPQAGASA